MRAFLQALRQMLAQWRESWRVRRRMDGPHLLAHELQFMPAADALRDSPPHPAPRVLLALILCLGVLTLLWATLGKVDVVSVAEGKVLAAGRSKPVQADSLAVVKQIHVQEGQAVKAGQLLVEFDATQTAAELQKLLDQRITARLEQARAQLLLDALEGAQSPRAPSLDDVPADRLPAWQAGVEARLRELRSGFARGDSSVAERDAEIASIRANIESLRQSLPINREMADDYRRLQAGKYVARHAVLERERLVLEQQQMLAAQQARLVQGQASRSQAAQERERQRAETRRTLLEQQQVAGQQLAALEQDLLKVRQRDGQTRLLAPVAGTVQQLAVSAPGAVVTSAQPVMMLVPADAPVEVEATLANRDVGFIRAGQAVKLKVDAFDFTRYGMFAGEVASVSSDAVTDPTLGPIYTVRIRLLGRERAANATALPLLPGMRVRAEIKTGQRRILDYFLSPLQRRLDESIRER